jgi:hypothetical protein
MLVRDKHYLIEPIIKSRKKMMCCEYAPRALPYRGIYIRFKALERDKLSRRGILTRGTARVGKCFESKISKPTKLDCKQIFYCITILLYNFKFKL